MSLRPVDYLRAAREIIATPETWTRGVWALDANGDELEDYINLEHGVCFCAGGALKLAAQRLMPEGHHGAWRASTIARFRLADAMNGNIPGFNDAETTTHADVLGAFDRAILIADMSP